MNDREIEERLRSVVDGGEPNAPPSLRRFLRDLPEAQPAHEGRFGWLAALRGSVAPSPGLRHAPVALALVVAIAIGLGGGGYVLSLRHSPTTPAGSTASPSGAAPTVPITPRRSTAADVPMPSWFSVPNMEDPRYGIVWGAIADPGNQALPAVAVKMPGGGHIGVTGPDELNGLVTSADGLHWNWTPASEIDPRGVSLTSIADGPAGLVLVGEAQGIDGALDARVYTSKDGRTWHAVPDSPEFHGIGMKTVVASANGYLAAGWNGSTAAGLALPTALWRSTDGVTWESVRGVPARGSVFIFGDYTGFLLSGQSLANLGAGYLPIWHSIDGVAWTPGYIFLGASSESLGPIVSAATLPDGTVVALSRTNDGEPVQTQLLMSSGDVVWDRVKSDAASGASLDVHLFTQIACIGQKLIATLPGADGTVYSASAMADGPQGMTWSPEAAKEGAPHGTELIPIGDSALLLLDRTAQTVTIWLGSTMVP